MIRLTLRMEFPRRDGNGRARRVGPRRYRHHYRRMGRFTVRWSGARRTVLGARNTRSA